MARSFISVVIPREASAKPGGYTKERTAKGAATCAAETGPGMATQAIRMEPAMAPQAKSGPHRPRRRTHPKGTKGSASTTHCRRASGRIQLGRMMLPSPEGYGGPAATVELITCQS